MKNLLRFKKIENSRTPYIFLYILLLQLCSISLLVAQKPFSDSYRTQVQNTDVKHLDPGLSDLIDYSEFISPTTSIVQFQENNTNDANRRIEILAPASARNIGKGALIGAGIGLGMGLIAGGSSGGDYIFTKGQARAAYGLLGLVSGAVVGVIIGATMKQKKYRWQ
jgi:hypothetical protein